MLPVPIGQGQARGVRFALSTIIPLFGAPKRDPSKNREMDWALALGGRRLIIKNNNQLVVGVHGGLDVGEEARWG